MAVTVKSRMQVGSPIEPASWSNEAAFPPATRRFFNRPSIEARGRSIVPPGSGPHCGQSLMSQINRSASMMTIFALPFRSPPAAM
jgi:hypothetical protein